jgi:calcineurin-like phosphoesterase family protein
MQTREQKLKLLKKTIETLWHGVSDTKEGDYPKIIRLYKDVLMLDYHDADSWENMIWLMWSMAINKKDTVWVLGDITMEKTKGYELLAKLNGFKKVVLGNHDKPQHVPELLKYVNSVSGMVKYKGYILTHCPIHESEIGRFTKNIHGHVHENSLKDNGYLNVSCEAVDYTPIRI